MKRVRKRFCENFASCKCLVTLYFFKRPEVADKSNKGFITLKTCARGFSPRNLDWIVSSDTFQRISGPFSRQTALQLGHVLGLSLPRINQNQALLEKLTATRTFGESFKTTPVVVVVVLPS